jgi:8-oxo-dGTP pyrophosphatase MutT (NUDIX family)
MSDCVRVSDVRDALARRVAHVLPGSGQRASVAVILQDAPTGVQVLLIERSRRADDPWSGHVAFPGGRREAADGDDLAAAIRETREEIGLDLSRQARLLGRLDELGAVARGHPLDMVIVPFVFELVELGTLHTNDEVSDVFWAPIGPLWSGEACENCGVDLDGHVAQRPAFRVQNRIVWGLTLRMLACLVDALAPNASVQRPALGSGGNNRD